MENRKYVDCREQDAGKSGCSLRISGTEKEVTDAAFQHAVSVHGLPNTSETKAKVAKALKDDVMQGASPSAGSRTDKPSEARPN